VALLVERVTEVFVSIWRDPAADLLEQQRDSNGEQQEIDRQAIADLNKELKDESPYSNLASFVSSDETGNGRVMLRSRGVRPRLLG
jgi:hypothetical protein